MARVPVVASRRVAGCGRRVALGGLVAVLVAGGCSGDGESAGSAREHDAVTTTTAPPEPVLRARSEPLPVVTPTPRDMRWLGDDVGVPATVTVTLAGDVDDGTRTAVREALAAAGAADVDIQVVEAGAGSDAADRSDEDPSGPTDERDQANEPDERGSGDQRGGRESGRRLTVSVGSLAEPETVATLAGVGLAVVPADLGDEGYALAAFRQSDGHDRVVLAGAGRTGRSTRPRPCASSPGTAWWPGWA